MTNGSTVERGRGILSKADREFLLGEKEELTEQSKRDARYRIRKRLENALLDMRLLADLLEPEDRKLVFENTIEETPHNVVFGGAFTLLIAGTYDIVEPIEHVPDYLEDSIGEAIFRTILDIDEEYLVEAEVDIDVTREKPDIEPLLAKYNSGEETLQELQYLLRRDIIEYDVNTAVRYLEHMRDEGVLERGEIQLMAEPDEEPVPVPYDDDADFNIFIEDFKEAWNEVMTKR